MTHMCPLLTLGHVFRPAVSTAMNAHGAVTGLFCRFLSSTSPARSSSSATTAAASWRSYLRPFYHRVHPDVLSSANQEVRSQNQKNLQTLNDLLDTAEAFCTPQTSQAGSPRVLPPQVQVHYNLEFWVKPDQESADGGSDLFKVKHSIKTPRSLLAAPNPGQSAANSDEQQRKDTARRMWEILMRKCLSELLRAAQLEIPDDLRLRAANSAKSQSAKSRDTRTRAERVAMRESRRKNVEEQNRMENRLMAEINSIRSDRTRTPVNHVHYLVKSRAITVDLSEDEVERAALQLIRVLVQNYDRFGLGESVGTRTSRNVQWMTSKPNMYRNSKRRRGRYDQQQADAPLLWTHVRIVLWRKRFQHKITSSSSARVLEELCIPHDFTSEQLIHYIDMIDTKW